MYIYICKYVVLESCELPETTQSSTLPNQKPFFCLPSPRDALKPRRESRDLRRRRCACPPRSWRRSRPPVRGCGRSRGPPGLGAQAR